jgi:cellulose synthase/poly-beta-1,6-N-acetylglucosamine synthase-like glycosyltransferase
VNSRVRRDMAAPAIVSSTTPSVSVVVPTYRRERILCDSLSHLLSQRYPHFEVVVVYMKQKSRLGLPLFVGFFAARGALYVARARGGARDWLRLMGGLWEGFRAFGRGDAGRARGPT